MVTFPLPGMVAVPGQGEGGDGTFVAPVEQTHALPSFPLCLEGLLAPRKSCTT